MPGGGTELCCGLAVMFVIYCAIRTIGAGKRLEAWVKESEIKERLREK